MEINTNIQDKINETLNAADAIEAVNVSPFFKDKTMHKLFTEKEERHFLTSWLTSSLQLAVLVCIVVLNIVAFSKMQTESYDENISEFAETYGLVISDNSIL
ncbi:hypothetical protein Q4566_07700 [Tamlana sp. 2_MG-2023]|uniref:hypothetical protein n=1 Tax=unclassified Tamlana TaxID=2614803 RepID=UPI0026E23AF1|nr:MULTISPECIES: hypothetical protein [unclassified Tamlana]MDO6760081.1 hypothetical protein [Tamlana sp. 2_MG-2023]MDO6790221.1 hypothetical protein [Tamlana sp. 1_MG-2023]